MHKSANTYAVPSQRASLNLAVKECIRNMCLDSESTLKQIFDKNDKSQINGCTNDLIKLTALSILKKLYRELRSEICRVDQGRAMTNDFRMMGFLKENDEESDIEVLHRYASEHEMKSGRIPLNSARHTSWREIDILPPSERLKERHSVPICVPPLDPIQIKECANAVTPICSTENRYKSASSSSTLSASPLKIISDNKIRSSEESSSSDNDIEDLQRISCEKDASGNTSEITHRTKELVDKGCGTTPRAMHSSVENITSDYLEKVLIQFSKGAQTDYKTEMKDVGTDASDFPHKNEVFDHENEEISSSVATIHSSSKFTESVNSSSTAPNTLTNSPSLQSSDLSAGQVPMRKAVLLLESSQRRLIPVNVDGSLVNSDDFQRNGVSSIKLPKPHGYGITVKGSDIRSHADGKTTFGIELHAQHHSKEEVYNNESIHFIPKQRHEQDYGISLKNQNTMKLDRENAFVNVDNSSIACSSLSGELYPTISSIGRAPLFVREASLVTSFDSSAAFPLCTNDRERFQQMIGSPTPHSNNLSMKDKAVISTNNRTNPCRNIGDIKSSSEKEILGNIQIDKLFVMSENSLKQTNSKLVERNIKFSSSSLSKTYTSQKSGQNIDDDDEESTLDQISPLPTTG